MRISTIPLEALPTLGSGCLRNRALLDRFLRAIVAPTLRLTLSRAPRHTPQHPVPCALLVRTAAKIRG